jgi:hypothetical protein
MSEQTTQSKPYSPHPSTVVIIAAVFFAAGIIFKSQIDKAPLFTPSDDATCHLTVSGSGNSNNLSADIRVQGTEDACVSVLGMLQGQSSDSDDQSGDDSASDATAASAPDAASQ